MDRKPKKERKVPQESDGSKPDLRAPTEDPVSEVVPTVRPQPKNGFHPIRISGEPLSVTIIRERREGW